MSRGHRMRQGAGKLLLVRCRRLAAEFKLQRCAQAQLRQERRGMMTCKRCAGEGEIRLQLYGTRDGRTFCEWRVHLCPDCAGMGVISDEQWVRQERGRLLREDRVGRGVTLREEAQRLGMSPQQLSQIEWGKR